MGKIFKEGTPLYVEMAHVLADVQNTGRCPCGTCQAHKERLETLVGRLPRELQMSLRGDATPERLRFDGCFCGHDFVADVEPSLRYGAVLSLWWAYNPPEEILAEAEGLQDFLIEALRK